MDYQANYEKLASQIVLQAVKDWKDYVKKIEKTKNWEDDTDKYRTMYDYYVFVDGAKNTKEMEKLEKKLLLANKDMKRHKNAIKKKKEVERFFSSHWCQTLSGIDGKKITTHLNEHMQEILNLEIDMDNLE